MRLRQKLFIILLLMSILPTICLTAVSYYRYRQTTQLQMQEYSTNLFSQAVHQTNNTLSELDKVSSLFTSYSSGNYSLIHNLKPYAAPKQVHSELEIYHTKQNLNYICQNLFNTYDFIYGIYLFTPSDTNFIFENTQNKRLIYEYTPTGEAWYQDTCHLQGDLYVSPIAVHDTIFRGTSQSFFISKKLTDIYTSQDLGTLIINCDPSVFDLSALNTIPDVTSISIANTLTGDIIYSSAGEYGAALEEIASAAAYSKTLDFSYLSIYTAVDTSLLYLEYSATGILLLGVAAICLICGFTLALYFSKFVTEPITYLSHEMSQQDEAHLTELFPMTVVYQNRTDEIGILYNEYISMLSALDTAIKTNYQNKLISLDAQMKSLEARINSHFLFNTLETINSIASVEGSQDIKVMTTALGNMFRYAIKTQSELVPFEEELDHVTDYISIQSIRFNKRFLFRVRVSHEMKKIKVLKLILQPIVENSFSHGLANCQYGDKIYVYGLCDKSFCYIHIIDNGRGMTEEELSDLKRSLMEEPTFTELGRRNSQSIGLKNINARIELYYGKGFGLSVQSKAGRGTLISIKLPYLKESTDV